MMKPIFQNIRNFLVPRSGTKAAVRILPIAITAVVMLALFLAGNFVWEETNQPSFCGLTCHTMPPQYITYQHSAHTNVSCEDCHMGRDRFFILLPRKVAYSWQTGSSMVLNTYEYPIVAKNMEPAREACENCHKPEVFTSDKLVEIRKFADDQANSATSIFLSVKVGGGTAREGLGYGIHWHVENQVQFYATDASQQTIPYVKVTNPDGTVTEYVDTESGFDPTTIQAGQLKTMDCITCHNRTSHSITSPSQTMDELLTRNLVSADIPFIKKKGVEVLSATYTSDQEALDAIAGLTAYYQSEQANYYKTGSAQVTAAVQAIQDAWKRTNFLDQKMNWTTHPDNLGHENSPGCFRCHDGKHLTTDKVSIRLECNICHSVPVVAQPDQLTTTMMLGKGFEPDSHKDSNWITLHRDAFDNSCQGCHTVEDAGGVSNTSFCSNSACHGSKWTFAGFDAPTLRQLLGPAATPIPEVEEETPAPVEETTSTPAPAGGKVTYEQVGGLFKTRCGACHGTTGMKGLNLTTYAGIMKGGDNGAVIIPGDPAASLLYQVQTASKPHFGQFSADELAQIKQWILDGALEK